jgi:hypothetical protein
MCDFHQYMKYNGSSESHQNNCLKTSMAFAMFLGPNTTFYDIRSRQDITRFLCPCIWLRFQEFQCFRITLPFSCDLKIFIWPQKAVEKIFIAVYTRFENLLTDLFKYYLDHTRNHGFYRQYAILEITIITKRTIRSVRS